jgi:hypothetical protein
MTEWWEWIDQDDAWQQMNENEYRRHQEEIEFDEVMHKEPSLWHLVSEWLKETASDRNN